MVKVSIIMPNKNKAKWLPISLNSVLNQSFKNWELIIVDDNSTDDSLRIIREFMDLDNRIDCICNPPSGYPLIKNLGLDHSSGKYVVFLDSDDWLGRHFLERGVAHIFDAYVSSFRIIRPDGSIAEIKFKPGIRSSLEGIKRRYWLGNGNSMLKRALIRKNGIQFPIYKYGEDVYFYVKYLSVANKVYVDDYVGLTINRTGSDLIVNTKRFDSLESILSVFRQLENEFINSNKEDLVKLIIKYSKPPSILTYLDGAPYLKRLKYGVKFFSSLSKFDFLNYYASSWYVLTFVDLFIPIKQVAKRLLYLIQLDNGGTYED